MAGHVRSVKLESSRGILQKQTYIPSQLVRKGGYIGIMGVGIIDRGRTRETYFEKLPRCFGYISTHSSTEKS